MLLGVQIDQEFPIDPGLQEFFGDADVNGVPLPVVEVHVAARLVVGGVVPIHVGDPHQAAAPATADEGAVLITDGNRQATEEIVARHTLGLEPDFVIHAEQRAGPGDARHVLALLQHDGLLLDGDLPLTEEIRLLPVA